MFYVVTYDISDNQRRVKVAEALEDYGDRVQRSVFEMELEGAWQLEVLQKRLGRVIDPGEDGVRIYFLCQSCREKVAILGQGKVYRDEDVYVI